MSCLSISLASPLGTDSQRFDPDSTSSPGQSSGYIFGLRRRWQKPKQEIERGAPEGLLVCGNVPTQPLAKEMDSKDPLLYTINPPQSPASWWSQSQQ